MTRRPLPVALLILSAAHLASAQTYTITTLAGTGDSGAGFSGDNGPATSAQLAFPAGIAVDSSGSVYIADTANNRIRKVTKGVITTVAGKGTPGFSGDNGPALSAQLYAPFGVAVDSAGNLYIADTGNARIRKVSGGNITTLATGSSGSLFSSIAVDSSGSVYVTDSAFQAVLKITGSTTTVVAGNQTPGYSGDNGPATSAQLYSPYGIATDAAGNLFIADSYNNVIRRVVNGAITTVAGTGKLGFAGDGGPASAAQMYLPFGLAVDPSGALFIADTGNHRLRKISGSTITTIAGSAGGGIPAGFSGDNGPGPLSQLDIPRGVAVDSAGNIYIADTGNHRIRVLTPGTDPAITTGGVVPINSPVSIVQSGSWISIFGRDLANGTYLWKGDFPTTLGGTSVTIDGKPAYLWFVSPAQLNVQVPDTATTGAVNVIVSTPTGIAASTVTLAPQAPSFSLLDRKHVAAIIATPDGSGAYGGGTYDLLAPATIFSFTTRPVKAGETLVLFGVGFGPTNPAVPAGRIVTSAAPSANAVTVTIGGVKANVVFSGITQAGLYQFNVIAPNAPSGEQPVVATVNGVSTPPGPVVTMQ